MTEQLLRREPDLVGIYIDGGGAAGVLEALSALGRDRGIVAIGHDLTEHTRMGLIDGLLSMVLSHPVQRLASDAVGHMAKDLDAGSGPTKKVLAFDIYGPENI